MMLICFELLVCLEDRWVVTEGSFVIMDFLEHTFNLKISQVCCRMLRLSLSPKIGPQRAQSESQKCVLAEKSSRLKSSFALKS